ncbi:hypothetical protein ABIB83_007954 [Bradyrhizobium sp. I1.8.5]
MAEHPLKDSSDFAVERCVTRPAATRLGEANYMDFLGAELGFCGDWMGTKQILLVSAKQFLRAYQSRKV